MTKYEIGSPEEQRKLNSMFGSQAMPIPIEALKANFTQAQKVDYQQAVIKHNQGKILGISADMVPDDIETQGSINSSFDQHIGLSPTWDKIATEYPAWSKTASDDVTTMVLAKEKANEMGIFERLVSGYSKHSRYNELEDQLNLLAGRVTDSRTSREQKLQYSREIQNLTYQQGHYKPDDFSPSFIIGQTGRGLVDMVKGSATDIYKTLLQTKRNKVASASDIAYMGAIGASAYLSGGMTAVFSTSLRHNINLGRNLITRMQINSGLEPNAKNSAISGIGGLALGLLDTFGGELAVKAGLKAFAPALLTKPILAQLEKASLKSNLTSSIVKQIVIDQNKYLGKPVSEAIWHATKSFVEQSAIASGETVLANMATNLSINTSLAMNGRYSDMQSIGDFAKSSFSGIPESIIGLSPLTGFASLSGAHGVYRQLRNVSENGPNTTRAILDKINETLKTNDLHEKTPEVMDKFYKNIEETTGSTGVKIDIRDATKQLENAGIDPATAFNNVGIGELYQKAINEGDDEIGVSYQQYNDILSGKVTEDGKGFSDVVVDAYKLDGMDFTANQEKEIVRLEKESQSEVTTQDNEPISPELDEIRDILTERLKIGLEKTGRSKGQIKEEATKNAELTLRTIQRLATDTGKSISEIKDLVMAEIVGPSFFEVEKRSTIASRVKAEMKDIASQDIAYKVAQLRKANKQIHIDVKDIADFKSVIDAYPKGTFTTEKTGYSWEDFGSQELNTTDMKEVVDALENGRFKTERDLQATIRTMVDRELAHSEYMANKAEVTMGSVDPTARKKVIRIFKESNQSTYQHEMAHIFLQTKFDFIRQGIGTEQFKTDWTILSEYLDIKPNQEALTRSQQETFARGYESYLKDGQAPSIELRGIFKTFRKWMMNIYKNMKAAVFSRDLINKTVVPDKEISALRAEGWIIDQELGINISPEMRGVFDRMLATQEEIDQVRADIGFNDNLASKMRAAGLSKYVSARLKKYADMGDEKAYRRLINAQMKELDKTFFKARTDFAKGQLDESVDGTIAHDMFQKNATLYAYSDMWSGQHGLSGPSKRDEAHAKMVQVSKDVLSGKADISELMGADLYTGSKSIPESAQKIIDSKPPSLELADRVAQATQDKYPHMMDSADFHERAMDAYHNIDSLTALLAQNEALKALGETSGESILRDVILPDVKAEAVDKLKDAISKLKLEKEQAIEKIEQSQLIKDWAAKEKADEKATRKKAEQMYDRMFKAIEYKESFNTLKASAMLIKESQRRIVADMTLKAIKKATRELITAERTASTLSAKYLAKGDIQKAIDHKYKQLKAHSKLSEAIKAQRKIDSNMKVVNKAKKSNYDKDKQQFHFDAAFDLLRRFGLEHKDSDRYQGGTIESWSLDENNPVDTPEWLTDPELSRDMDSLKPFELQDLADTLKAILHIANMEDKIMRKGKWVAMDEANDEAIAFAKENDKSFKYQESKQAKEKTNIIKSLANSALTSFISFEKRIKGYAANLDVTDNPIHQMVIQPLRDVSGQAETMIVDVRNRFLKINAKINLSKMLKQMTEFEFRKGENMSVYGIYGIYLNMGTELNKKRLIDGHRDKFGEHWTEDYVKAMGKYMTKDMMDAVQATLDISEEIYPELAGLHERISGFAPVKELPIKIESQHGEYRGGYSPLVLAEGFVNQSLEMKTAREARFADYSGYQTYTSANRYQKRAKGEVKYVVSVDPMKIQRAVLENIRDTYYREPMLSLTRLMRSEKFRNLIYSKYGDEGVSDLLANLEYIATNGVSANRGVSKLESAIVDPLVSARTVGTMAMNIAMGMADLTSFFFMAPRYIGVKGTVVAAARMVKDVIPSIAVRTAADVYDVITRSQIDAINRPDHYNDIISDAKQSALMRYRFEDRYQGLHRLTFADGINDKSRWLNDNLKFGFFHWTQLMQEIPVWTVTRDRVYAETGNMKKAMDSADATIVEVFGSARLEDRIPHFRTSTGLKRALNMFQSWMATQGGNMWLEAQKIKQGNNLQRAQSLGYVLSFMMVSPLASAWMSGSRPKDDESIWQWAAFEDIGFATRMLVPVVGPIFSRKIAGKLTGRNDYNSKLNYTSAFKGLEDAFDAYDTTKGYLAGDNDLAPTLENWSKVMTSMPYVPWVNQTHNLLWNMRDIMTGEMEAEPIDLIKRRPKSERE